MVEYKNKTIYYHQQTRCCPAFYEPPAEEGNNDIQEARRRNTSISTSCSAQQPLVIIDRLLLVVCAGGAASPPPCRRRRSPAGLLSNTPSPPLPPSFPVLGGMNEEKPSTAASQLRLPRLRRPTTTADGGAHHAEDSCGHHFVDSILARIATCSGVSGLHFWSSRVTFAVPG